MSKFQKFFVICLIALASGLLANGSVIKPKNSIEGRAKVDDDLREIVEFLRLQMKCGYKPAGIPPLAPYHQDYKSFDIDTGVWSIKGNLSDFIVSGLDDFQLQAMSWHNVLQRLSFDFLFESVKFNGKYQTDVWTRLFGEALHAFGDGQLDLELQDLHFYGSFKLRPTISNGLHVYAFKITTEIGNVISKTTGIMNSKLYSKFFNSWIEEWLDMLINDNQDEMADVVEGIVVPPMNRLLRNVTMIELIALILGFASDHIPSEAYC